MTKREQLKRLVILHNHPECKTYEEAIEIERNSVGAVIQGALCENGEPLDDYPIEKIILNKEDIRTKCEISGLFYIQKGKLEYVEYWNYGLLITIGRVMNALSTIKLTQSDEYAITTSGNLLVIYRGYDTSPSDTGIWWEQFTHKNGQEIDIYSKDENGEYIITDETIDDLLSLFMP